MTTATFAWRLRDIFREDPSHRVELFFILAFISCFEFQQFLLFVSHKSSFFFFSGRFPHSSVFTALDAFWTLL